jgi:hypothetical protein
MITGQEQPDEGQVAFDRGVTIGYFSQDVGEMSGCSAVSEVMEGAGPVSAVAAELKELEAAMGDPDRADGMEDIIERYGEVQGRFDMWLRNVRILRRRNDRPMKRKPRLKRWQGPDHSFAISAVALFSFLFVAGPTNWLSSGNQAWLLQAVRARRLRQLIRPDAQSWGENAYIGLTHYASAACTRNHSDAARVMRVQQKHRRLHPVLGWRPSTRYTTATGTPEYDAYRQKQDAEAARNKSNDPASQKPHAAESGNGPQKTH